MSFATASSREGHSMSSFRFLENWLFDSTVGLSASSETAGFPASNLARHGRAEVWRSSGTFVITASNGKINFKTASGGSELTATVPPGQYTADELAAEIAFRMNAVSGSVISCSYNSSTGYWTISTTGSFLSLLFLTGTDTATNIATDIGFSRSFDMTGGTSYISPFIAIHTEEWVLIDLRTWATNPVDSFAMLFDQRTGCKFSPSATITLEANQTNLWTSPALATSLSLDDNYDIITHFYSSNQDYRYWRIKIVDPRNPYLYVEIPKLMLAKSVQLTQVPETGFTVTDVDLSKLEQTPYGNIYADIYPTRREMQFALPALSSADLEDLHELYKRVGKTTPIAVALDPLATLWDKDRFFLYGRFGSDFGGKQRFYSYFDTGFTVVEAL